MMFHVYSKPFGNLLSIPELLFGLGRQSLINFPLRNIYLRSGFFMMLCLFCMQSDEDLMHCLYFCYRAWDVWKTWDYNFTIWSYENGLKFRWVYTLKHKGPQAHMKEMTIAYGIWKSRNEALFEKVSHPVPLILNKCLSFYSDNNAATPI